MNETRIRWSLDVVDHGAGAKLLRQDRALRTSVTQTDKAYAKLGTTTTSVTARQVASADRATRALTGLSHGATQAAHGTENLSRAQSHNLAVSQRIAAQSDAIAAAYNRRGAAAERLSMRERAAARMQTMGASAVGVANRGLGGAAIAGAAGARVAGAGALGVGIVGLAATAKAISLGNQYNRVIDSQNVGFTTLFRSQEKAARFMAQIQALALKSPVLDIETTGNAARTLMAYGIAIKDVLPLTKAIGDSSAASGKQIMDVMPRAAMAIGQIASKGKLQAEEMNQLAESVGLSRGRIRKALGMTRGEFEATFKPGANIKAEVALPAILRALQDQSAGAADRLAKTTAGKLQRAQEVIGRAAGQLTRPIYNAIGDLAGGVADRLVKVDFTSLGKTLASKLRDVGHAAAAGLRVGIATAGDALGGITAGLGGRDVRGPTRGRAAGALAIGANGDPANRAAEDPSTAQRIGQKVGAIARNVGATAITAGRQLLDAFRPALPFFQNVLLPLLIGLGKGLLVSVVGAFKVAVPIIKIFATVLGFVGRIAAPFKGIIQGIGTVVGFLAAGPILKLLQGLGRLGGLFRLMGAPIGFVTGLFGKLFGAVRGLPGVLGRVGGFVSGLGGKLTGFASGAVGGVVKRLAGAGGRILSTVGGWATAAGRGLSRMPARLAATAYSAGRAVVDRIGSFVSPIGKLGGRLIRSIINGARGILGDLGSFFASIGRAIVRAITGALRGAGGAVKNALLSLVPGPIRGAISKVFGGRRGGRVPRYQGGGLIPSRVSPGEMLVYPNGAVGMVPGPHVAADSVSLGLPAGTAVLTGHGQELLAGGAGIADVLRSQQPHFAKGGVVPGKYTSTAYGPPWGGIQGTGVTATGVNLRRGPHLYGVAVDPSMIPLGSQVYTWPNPFGRSGPFRAFDTGGAIKGRRVDFYDWRGRSKQNAWGRRGITVGTAKLHGVGRGDPATGDATAKVPIAFGRSRTRNGLLDDAFTAALDAARAGTTPGRDLFSTQLREALAGIATTRDVKIPGQEGGTGGRGNLPGGVYTPSATWNPRRKPIARWIGPYLTYGASHGWGGTVTSGYRTKAEQTRIWNSGVRPAARPGTSNHEGSTFPRGAVDVSNATQLASALAKKPAPRLLQYAGAKDPVHFSHPHGGSYRVGGIVSHRGGAAPISVGRRLTTGLANVTAARGGSLDAFVGIVDDALSSRLEVMRRRLIAQVRRGGDAKVISRLQAAISAIDNTLGARVGRILRLVDREKIAVDRGQGALDRRLRRAGTDPASAAGIAAQIDYGATTIVPGAQRNVQRLTAAAARARAAGQPQAARAIEDELATAQDDLDEAVTTQVERQRDYLAAVAEAVRQAMIDNAQAQVDAAQFGLDIAQNAMAGLDVSQRLARTADTPAGMLERAQAIQANLLPALEGMIGPLTAQRDTLAALGDSTGARQATLAIQQAGNDIAGAMADAADLVRQAATQAAQDVVDAATHRRTMNDLGLSRLELEQRIAGTFDTGGVSRADYIKQQIIPAITAELTALVGQQATAVAQGDAKLADQIAEAIAGKQNEILQATLDATEAIADNTEPRKFGGGLTLGYQGETLTDAMIAAGNGA
jgi:tape measure domain-containing protein